MATKKKTATKTAKKTSAKGAKKTGRKKQAKSSTEKLRKDAIRSADANIARLDRLDGEALAEASRTSRRKVKADAKGNKGAKPKAKREKKASGKVSGLDLAAKVLADAGEPLNAKTIAERAIAAGWKTNGKTPHATLYSAIIREIATKGSEARFKKADRGMFAASGKGA
jgi:hypothetical protein